MTIKDVVDTIFQTRVISSDQKKMIHRRLRWRAYTNQDLEALQILNNALLGGIVIVNRV